MIVEVLGQWKGKGEREPGDMGSGNARGHASNTMEERKRERGKGSGEYEKVTEQKRHPSFLNQSHLLGKHPGTERE